MYHIAKPSSCLYDCLLKTKHVVCAHFLKNLIAFSVDMVVSSLVQDYHSSFGRLCQLLHNVASLVTRLSHSLAGSHFWPVSSHLCSESSVRSSLQKTLNDGADQQTSEGNTEF